MAQTQSKSPRPNIKTYRPDIDGLRALAIVAVIANHFNSSILPSGYLGVDIFFVISGYVITASLMANPGMSLQDYLLSFYARRVKRLIPALVLFITIMAILICLFNPTAEDSLNTGLAALPGLSNLYLREKATDYFADSTQLNVFTHTWSLGVEEQFYLVYPLIAWYCLQKQKTIKPLLATIAGGAILLIFLLLSKASTGHLFGLIPGQLNGLRMALTYLAPALLVPIVASCRLAKSEVKNLIITATILSLISLTGFLTIYPIDQPSAYFLMPLRFWELGAGCLLLLACSHTHKAWVQKLRQTPSLPICIGLCTALFLPLENGRIATLIVVILTSALIACLQPGDIIYRLLTLPPLVKLGLISYSLYLWHWGVLAISRWTIGIHAWSAPLQLLLMLLLAWASYHYVETPLRRASWSKLRHQTIGIGLGALVGGAGLLSALNYWGKELSLDRHFSNTWSAGLLKGRTDFLQQSQLQNRVDPKAMEATLTKDEKGLPLARPRLYIFGDSHSNHYVSALKKALTSMGVGSASVGWQCGYISALDISSQTKQWMNDCEKYPQFVDNFLEKNLQPGDSVLIGHRWKEKKRLNHSESTLNHLASLTKTKGANLIVIDDVPEIDTPNPLLCNKTPWRPFAAENCNKLLSDVNIDQIPFDAVMGRMTATHQNVRYALLRDIYCEDLRCGLYKNNLIIYRDTDHLTPEASQLGAARIAEIILGKTKPIQ
jgi:peptidoglycan/LPS O-acetylase OafA/YrhL